MPATMSRGLAVMPSHLAIMTRGPSKSPLIPSVLRAHVSRAEAALPLSVGTQGAEEVDLAEVGPEGVAEVELRVRALPEHEATESLLTGGTDDKVGIRLPAGVEVVRDVLDVEHARHLL